MVKVQTVIGIITAMATLFAVAAPPASAGFSSLGGKATEGESKYLQLTVEGNGATFGCLNTGLPSSPATWVIESELKAATSGPDLAVKIKSWGTCGTEAKELKSEVTAGECELELKEPKEEATVLVGILTTCLMKVETQKKETCEVRLEPTGNKELKSVLVSYSGEANENLVLEYGISGVSTSVNKACETAGIKSTKEARLKGIGEEQNVRPGVIAPTFTVSYLGNVWVPVATEKRSFIVSNIGEGAARPTSVLPYVSAANYWEFSNVAACSGLLYLPTQACEIKVEKRLPMDFLNWVTASIQVLSPNNGVSSASVIG
jgi:hypothetical protein